MMACNFSHNFFLSLVYLSFTNITVPSIPIVRVISYMNESSLHVHWNSTGAGDYILYYWKTSAPSDVYTITTASSSYNFNEMDSKTYYGIIVSGGNRLGYVNSSVAVGYTTPGGMHAVHLNLFKKKPDYMIAMM